MTEPVLHGLVRPFAHGRAFSEALPVANPAVGGGFTYTCPSKYWQRLAALAFTLVTDGNAANRQVTLSVVDQDSVVLAKVAAGGTQAASLTRIYSFLPQYNAAPALAVDTFTVPLPDLFLRPQWKVIVAVGAGQVGDQISALRVIPENFDTGPEGYPIGMVEESRAASLVETLGN